jgi:membrane protein required for colicin V production
MGFKKGFVISLFTLLALLVGLYAGIHFSDFLSNWFISSDVMNGEYTSPVSFTIVFLVVGAMVYFIGVLIQRLLKVVQLNTLNKLIGLLLGLIKSAYILSFAIVLLESYDERGDFISDELKEGSALYMPTKQICLFTLPAIKETVLLQFEEVKSDLDDE